MLFIYIFFVIPAKLPRRTKSWWNYWTYLNNFNLSQKHWCRLSNQLLHKKKY